MTYLSYKSLHIAGLILVFLAIGGWTTHMLNGGTRDTLRVRGLVAGLHGAGMLLLLVAGFGLIAKMQVPWRLTNWVGGKTLLWLVLGAFPVLAFRKPQWIRLWMIGAVLIGVLAALLALYKP